ncbi:hypothetical protein LCGC14_2353980 [marine sediment metagenome]|uniref:Uncharacterized protein n=1 Tax=marine sediment metagenome TaxID=412755 RepID=A0A0F9CVW9_9ZZZZ
MTDKHTPRYFLTELNDGLQWLTDGQDFGMHPDAAPKLLKALQILANAPGLDRNGIPTGGRREPNGGISLANVRRIARDAIKAAKGDA